MGDPTPNAESVRYLGVLMRQLREAANLTQADLAALMGTPTDGGRVTVSYWENGTRRPSLDQVPKLAACLGYWPIHGSAGLRRRLIEDALLLHMNSGTAHIDGSEA